MTELNSTERMKEDFVANVSHEMRTPLTVIQGYLEMIEEEASGSMKSWLPFIHEMQSQMHRLEDLLEDLLLLSKLQSKQLPETEIEQLDISNMIEDLASDASSISNGKHRFKLNLNKTLFLKGNEKELCSCFGNLIHNAVRYSPDGGNILLNWQLHNKHTPMFSVQDHGLGIAAKHISRLTERFYRVDKGRSRATGGTGLGLSIVKHILLRHQAHLEIESRIGEGSHFICYFNEKNDWKDNHK